MSVVWIVMYNFMFDEIWGFGWGVSRRGGVMCSEKIYLVYEFCVCDLFIYV